MLSFLKMNRGEDIDNMILEYPSAFILITVIARRARRESSKILGLNTGECYIGDYEHYGMTRSQYRRSQKKLEEWGLCSFISTSKGTTASIISDACYCINADQQNDQRETNERPTRDQRETTNKEGKNERMKEGKIISSNEDKELALVPEFGKDEINLMQKFLRQAVGVSAFKDTKERWYVTHCYNLMKKIGKDEFQHRLKTILQDEFKAKNANKLQYLYNEIKAFIHSPVIEPEVKKPRVLIF